MKLARATAASSTVQSLQTCMYVPAGQNEGWGEGGEKWEGEGEERAGEYVESGRRDGGVAALQHARAAKSDM